MRCRRMQVNFAFQLMFFGCAKTKAPKKLRFVINMNHMQYAMSTFIIWSKSSQGHSATLAADVFSRCPLRALQLAVLRSALPAPNRVFKP